MLRPTLCYPNFGYRPLVRRASLLGDTVWPRTAPFARSISAFFYATDVACTSATVIGALTAPSSHAAGMVTASLPSTQTEDFALRDVLTLDWCDDMPCTHKF